MSEVEVAPRIVINDAVHPGRPIVKGTRIPVSLVLGSLSSGMTMAQISAEYDLTEEDIRAAIDYARNLVDQETVYPLPVSAAS